MSVGAGGPGVTNLHHLGHLRPLLRRVLGLDEQLLQQGLLVQPPHQLALQVLLHKVHQEVHHRLRDTGDVRRTGRSQCGQPHSNLPSTCQS